MKKLLEILCAGAMAALLGGGVFGVVMLPTNAGVVAAVSEANGDAAAAADGFLWGAATAWAQPANGEGTDDAGGNSAGEVEGTDADIANREDAVGAHSDNANEAKSDGNDAANGDGEQSSEGAEDGQASEQPEIDPNNQMNPQQMPDSSFLYDTSIAELADADSYMNNQTVQVVGEAIGDILVAVDGPNYAWVMLQEKVDTDYPQISVLMTRTQSDLIDHLGRYGVQGTKLQVRGQFHLSCPQHDGLSDLHAENVTVVARGSVTPDTLDVQQFAPGAVLFVVAGILLLVFRRLREGQR